jgi:hypothetical protein
MTKRGLTSEEQHPFDLYCVRWKRRDGSDRFHHFVRAQSITEAMSRSRDEISLVLGSNAGLWQMEEPHRSARTQYRPSAVLSVRSTRHTVHRMCLVTANLLALGLVLFAFHRWTSMWPHSIGSLPNLEGAARSEVIAPDAHSEETHVMRS